MSREVQEQCLILNEVLKEYDEHCANLELQMRQFYELFRDTEDFSAFFEADSANPFRLGVSPVTPSTLRTVLDEGKKKINGLKAALEELRRTNGNSYFRYLVTLLANRFRRNRQFCFRRCN